MFPNFGGDISLKIFGICNLLSVLAKQVSSRHKFGAQERIQHKLGAYFGSDNDERFE